jgi:hypothetical protein
MKQTFPLSQIFETYSQKDLQTVIRNNRGDEGVTAAARQALQRLQSSKGGSSSPSQSSHYMPHSLREGVGANVNSFSSANSTKPAFHRIQPGFSIL